MPVVIGTKVYMKLYITKYMCAKFCAFGINIYSDICRIIDITAILKFKMTSRYHVGTNFI